MTIDDIRTDYARHNGGHWFDADTLRFWGTRLSSRVFTTPVDGTRAYFITSEYKPFRREPGRLYSVRVYDFATHKIDTISFQKDRTLAQAVRRARFFAGAKVPG